MRTTLRGRLERLTLYAVLTAAVVCSLTFAAALVYLLVSM
jgi:hypothetical protein